MYKRLRDGLFAPKNIIEYITDKMYMPFLILIVYAILMTIPIIISNLTFGYWKRSRAAGRRRWLNLGNYGGGVR